MIAHIVTGANLASGFMAILLCLSGHLEAAAWLIVAASFLDALDGKAARYFGSTSSFGMQFDSLADMVSFGAAPGVLVYSAVFRQWGAAGALLSCVPVLMTAIRLARFNLTADGKAHDFSGLSAPMQACLTATFVIMHAANFGTTTDKFVLLLLVLVTSGLMVSSFPMPGLPRLSLRETGLNQVKLVFVTILFVVAAIDPQRLAFPVLLVAAITGFGTGFIQWLNGRDTRLRDFDDSSETATMYRGQQ